MTKQPQNPLITAIKSNNAENFHRYLNLYENTTHNSYTNLMVCARFDRPEFITFFLHQAKKRSPTGMTALMIAADQGSSSCCKQLISLEIHLTDRAGWTALMHAANRSNTECVNLCIQELHTLTTAPTGPFPPQVPALFIAAVRNCVPAVEILLEEAENLTEKHINLIYDLNGSEEMAKRLFKVKNLQKMGRTGSQKLFAFETLIPSEIERNTPRFALQSGSGLKNSLKGNIDDSEGSTPKGVQNVIISPPESAVYASTENQTGLSLQDQIDALNSEESAQHAEKEDLGAQKNKIIEDINKQFDYDGTADKMEIKQNSLIQTFNYITGQRSKEILSNKNLSALEMSKSFIELKQDIQDSALSLKQSIIEHEQSVQLVPLSYIQRQKRLNMHTLEKGIQIIEQWQNLSYNKEQVEIQGQVQSEFSPCSSLKSPQSVKQEVIFNDTQQYTDQCKNTEILSQSANCQVVLPMVNQFMQTENVYTIQNNNKNYLIVPLAAILLSIILQIFSLFRK